MAALPRASVLSLLKKKFGNRVRAISEEIRTLGKVLQAVQRGGNLGNALRDMRVRKDKQGLIEHAARRLKFPLIERAIQQAARLDKTIKGLRQGDVWGELLQLGLRFAQK